MDITPVKQEVEQFLYDHQAVEIKSQEDYTSAGDVLKMVSNKIKKLEDKRKEWTAPMLAAKKKIDDDFKEVTKPLEEFIANVKVKMLDFYKVEQARLDAEQNKLEVEALKKAKETNTSEVAVPVVNDIKTQRGDIATTSVKKTWTFEIVNEAEVPKEFLMVNESAIKEAIKNEVRQIPGVRIYQEESISLR